jgi:lipopolysaccharide/colanic/teichoic acid biosynthesis glycosyltransferase
MALRKRVLDVVLGTVLAVVAAPLVAVLAAAAAWSLRAWPFFVQDRVGLGGRPFRMVKIRTLPASAPAYADKYAIRQVETSRFCAWLRASHLDELPQLFLVPPGRMSLVGPRPEMATLLASFDQRFVAARCAVRPGCTGLWQLGPDSGKLIGESPRHDLLYLRYGNLRLDVWILWRTVRTLAHIGGSVELEDAPRWTGAHGDGVVDDPVHRRQATPLALVAPTGQRGVGPGGEVVDLRLRSSRSA